MLKPFWQYNWIMCLKITSKKVYVYSAGRMEIGIESHRQWHHIKISERKVPSQSVMQRCEPEERNLWATNFEERSLRHQPIDETTDDAEARNEFLSIEENYIHRHHVEPRVQLSVPKEETVPTHTNLDVLPESRINNYWNVNVDRNLSHSWTGFTKFTILNEKSPKRIHVAQGAAYKRFKQRPWPEIWSRMSNAAQKKKRSRNGRLKNLSSVMLEN